MDYERIDETHQGEERVLHEERYRLAGRYTEDTDVVLDAACGTGYGKAFLKGRWIGVDKEPLCGNLVGDLNEWEPSFTFDVFVGFETIEHLDDYRKYVEVAKQAKRFICLSTPIIPTVHRNRFHRHDFDKQDIETLIDREVVEYHEQIGTYGVWVFRCP